MDLRRDRMVAVFATRSPGISSGFPKLRQLQTLGIIDGLSKTDYVRSKKAACFPPAVDLPSEKMFFDRREARHNCCDPVWGNTAREYCKNTSLHGLKYVGDTELNLFERLCWSVTFVTGVLAAAYFITILYARWRENPMIVTLSSKATLVDTIPFPAVTICNMNGARKSIAEPIYNDKEATRQTMFEKHMLRKMCSTESDTKVNASWNEIQQFMVKVSQPCHSMLVTCSWSSETFPCEDLFNTEITDEGVCCAFNKVERRFIYRNPRELHGLNYTFPYPAIDWTPESGYPDNAPLDAIPWRVIGPGKGLGMTVVLDAEVADYYCSSTASVGFKILLHSPVETPRISEFAYFLIPGRETRVEIIPRISTTTSDLVNIPQSKRRCVFSSERNLRFYRTYTQRNCELECQSNFTLKQCSCVPFYLPKDVDTRICGTADDDCVNYVREIAENRPKNRTGWDQTMKLNCSCMPSCVQIFYAKQMSTGILDDTFDVERSFLNGRDLAYFKKNMAVVHFFFVEHSFTSFEKGEIFGFTDFLSNTGGLLGLFLGFSFLSVAEIAYFSTIKIFCSRFKRNRLKSDPPHMKTIPFAQ